MTLDLSYAITPFAAWLVAGCLKFAINSLRSGGAAFGQIGYGGLPSNHSTIVSAMAALVALREGIATPAFGIALTLAFIVMLDAGGLRRHIERQARAVNALGEGTDCAPLRERIGHSRLEIGSGILTGVLVAWAVNTLA